MTEKQLFASLNATGNRNTSIQNSSVTASNSPVASSSDSYVERMVFVVAMVIFSIAGFCGNWLIILTIVLVRGLRSTRNAFLANLAVSDIVLIIIVVPFNIASVLRGQRYWRDRFNLCQFVASICAPSCLTAIWSVTGVAFNRYFFICRHEIYDKYFSPGKTVVWIVGLWALSFGIHLPNHLGWGHSGYMKDFYLCTRETKLVSYSIFFSTIGIVLPLAISFLSYCRIYALVRTTTIARKQIIRNAQKVVQVVSPPPEHTTSDTGSPTRTGRSSMIVRPRRIFPTIETPGQAPVVEKSSARHFRHEILLVKTLFRSFAVFLLAWLPMAVLLMLPGLEAPTWVYLVVVFFAHGSTATNSILYFTTNEDFRKGFRAAMEKLAHRHNSQQDDTSADLGRRITA